MKHSITASEFCSGLLSMIAEAAGRDCNLNVVPKRIHRHIPEQRHAVTLSDALRIKAISHIFAS
jgi:hypothetical protein